MVYGRTLPPNAEESGGGGIFLCGVSYPLSVEAGHSVEEEVSFIKGTGNLPSLSSGKTLEFR